MMTLYLHLASHTFKPNRIEWEVLTFLFDNMTAWELARVTELLSDEDWFYGVHPIEIFGIDDGWNYDMRGC